MPVESLKGTFKFGVTPYYLSLALGTRSPVSKIFLPSLKEESPEGQNVADPLGEDVHSPLDCLIHRYSDRVVFLVTDICSVYCRFCTRKRFTGQDGGFVKADQYEKALAYISKTKGIREVILSGGDPLTLSNSVLDRVLTDLRKIDHVEIIRIGSRMPVVCPMRIDTELAKILRKAAPVFVMSHFNHPKELTLEAKVGLDNLVDHGVPVFNQMVLLNGINNHPAIVQALSRRLLYLRVKPYYMFQCDPSEGTEHLKTSIENSEAIQKELWGHLSGLAMPNLCVDIPGGGGKVGITPNFLIEKNDQRHVYKGWDGITGVYQKPSRPLELPVDIEDYTFEWNEIKLSQGGRI